MTAFRDTLAKSDPRSLDEPTIREVCADTFAKRHFTIEPESEAFRYEFDEDAHWELFLGHALDAASTRERRRFTTWALVVGDAAEPLLAVRWDIAARRIHVTRSILCRTTEGYDAGGGVIDTRDTVRRVRELVGTVDLAATPTAGRLRDRLSELLFLGVVGLSRLPLTSVDAPLPEFSLGRLGYCFRPDDGVADVERAKRLELAIRATPADRIAGTANASDWASFAADFRGMFDSVSLSPWTDFVPKALAWLRHVDGPAGMRRFALLARLVVRIARHLNAYDLVTFHHFGANYPDALLIEACLGELLAAPESARDADWEDGVRAAALVVVEYAGHRVPDAPTSQGEAARVLPPEYPPVPADQIASPHTRNRRLFADRSIVAQPTVRLAVAGLDRVDALIELGTALFIDRPLGVGKVPGETDHTWLGSHVLFSRTLAEKRLRRLAKHADLLPDSDAGPRWRRLLDGTSVPGIPLERRDAPARPGMASLHDAFMVADDFVLLCTTRRAVRDFARQYDCSPLETALPIEQWHVVIPTVTDDGVVLTVYDREYRSRVRLEADLSRGFVRAGGTEYVAAGFRVIGEKGLVLQAHSS